MLQITQLDNLEHTDTAELAFEYLTKLLHKVSLSETARLLLTSNVTVKRWIDPEKPVESINRLAAGYIILMCQTNHQCMRVLEGKRRANRYYNA